MKTMLLFFFAMFLLVGCNESPERARLTDGSHLAAGQPTPAASWWVVERLHAIDAVTPDEHESMRMAREYLGETLTSWWHSLSPEERLELYEAMKAQAIEDGVFKRPVYRGGPDVINPPPPGL